MFVKRINGRLFAVKCHCLPEKIYEAFLADSFDYALVHGHSYTANPLGCAAALASLELLKESRALLQRIEATHQKMLRHMDEI